MNPLRGTRENTVAAAKDIVAWGSGLRGKLTRLGFPCLNCEKTSYDAEVDVYSCPTFWRCRRVQAWFKDHWQYAVEDILEV